MLVTCRSASFVAGYFAAKSESTSFGLFHVVVHLKIVTARTENQPDWQGAAQVNAFSAVFRPWVEMSGERKAGVQYRPVGVAFGALRINLETQ